MWHYLLCTAVKFCNGLLSYVLGLFLQVRDLRLRGGELVQVTGPGGRTVIRHEMTPRQLLGKSLQNHKSAYSDPQTCSKALTLNAMQKGGAAGILNTSTGAHRNQKSDE